MKKVRESNFELMRIISMFMIVLWHILLYGINTTGCPDNIKMAFDFFRSIMVVHVNSFILLTGYFQYKKTFRMSKVISLNNASIFYRVLILIIFLIFNIEPITHVSILRNIFPFDLENYWFIRLYMLLYLVSPFLNRFIASIDKNEHKKLLIVLFLIFSIISSFTNQEAIYNVTNYGYSLISFMFLYFIGSYLGKYKIENTYFGKNFTKNFQQQIFVLVFCLCFVLNFSLHIVSEQMLLNGQISKYLGNILYISFNQYDNPLVIIGAVSYFMFFSYIKIQSKFINTVSSTVLGVYLIHENLFLRRNIYKLFNFPDVIYSRRIFIKIILVAFIIFVVCSIIEFIRTKIFKFIYNRKFANKFRIKYRNYINSLGIKIDW